MAFARTLLAAWMAVAVALMPPTGGAAVVTNAAATVMSDPAAMPCCDHMDQCGEAAGCALKCFSAVALAPTSHMAPAVLTPARLWIETPVLHAHVIPPPTHPPPG
jgi:hypothetical protein